ncbi:MAG: protease inhibitor I42 family protein [Kiritimatiellia bacterium]|nr:protease inhibitor I42 family protein [Kiritimatiellia bacterium]
MVRQQLIILFMLTLAMAGCAFPGPIQLAEADNGRTNSIDVGREIEVILKGNPTTGYSWDMASFSTNKLQQIGAVEYLQSEQSDGKYRVGVGGKFVFRFKAIGSGQGRIKLIYRRPWETTDDDKVYSVVFDVQ